MIRIERRAELDRDEAAEVASLLDEAARYDEEAGFSTARPAEALAGSTHLLVRMAPPGGRGSAALDRLPDVGLVGYLKVEPVTGGSEVQCVIRPEFRSLGVATLVVERLRAEGALPVSDEAGPARVWSHGGHPAAERVARRFGAEVDAAVAKTACYLPALSPPLPEPAGLQRQEVASFGEVIPGHAAAAAPGERGVLDLPGTAYLAAADADGAVLVATGAGSGPAHLRVVRTVAQHDDVLRHQLLLGCQAARAGGARLAVLYLDPTDEPLVHAALAVGFVHEHSDLRFSYAP